MCSLISTVISTRVCSSHLFVFFQNHFTFTFQNNTELVGDFYPLRSSPGQAVVTGVVPSPPRYVPSFFIAHRVQHSRCSSIFIECCWLMLSGFPLTNFHGVKFLTSLHSMKLEPPKLILIGTRTTYTKLPETPALTKSVLAGRRYPAQPVFVRILQINPRESYKFCGHKTTPQRYQTLLLRSEQSRQCNAVSSYWIKQARHTHYIRKR